MHAKLMDDGRWLVSINGVDYTFVADTQADAIAMAWQIKSELRN